ncbi:MAG: hypothetical protein RsTaC01_0536 [Candidatus Paraimprobicoccus trichonymphae]|uniref:Lipoprotein n=1 Tax=Candidatus Paraimprobicoccus trichonymphae TaxID=3033793 RepID=A0AA48KW72_9FIRM|nr:MAG: hypothetical protein RsTaC01_0536 [Candidatus Paraimprobicoccus trichonymphae]
MFNKKINKILAVNLALGLSFVGCNFRAVDTKPHEILEWVKVNPKKSVLIGLIPLLRGAGNYLSYIEVTRAYQYSRVKFYDTKTEAENAVKNVKFDKICMVTDSSRDTTK